MADPRVTQEDRERARELAKLVLAPYAAGERDGDWNLAAFMMRDHPLVEQFDLKDLAWAMCKETAHKNDVIGLIEYLFMYALATVRAEERAECAKLADKAMLVPPDGGAPTTDEVNMCETIAAAIRARGGKENG